MSCKLLTTLAADRQCFQDAAMGGRETEKKAKKMGVIKNSSTLYGVQQQQLHRIGDAPRERLQWKADVKTACKMYNVQVTGLYPH